MFQNKDSASVKANILFSGTDKNLKFNINQKDFVEKKEGDIIFRSGDAADYIYLILDGEVKLKITGVFSSPVIIKHGKNEFFGEKELLENSKRTSSAVANTPCLLYRIESGILNSLVEKSSSVKRNVYKSLLLNEPNDHNNQPGFFINPEDSPQKFVISKDRRTKKETAAEVTQSSKAADETEEKLSSPGNEKLNKQDEIQAEEKKQPEETPAPPDEEIIPVPLYKPVDDLILPDFAPGETFEIHEIPDENIFDNSRIAEKPVPESGTIEPEKTGTDETVTDLSEAGSDEVLPGVESPLDITAEDNTEQEDLNWDLLNEETPEPAEPAAAGKVLPEYTPDETPAGIPLPGPEDIKSEVVFGTDIFSTGENFMILKELSEFFYGDIKYPVSTLKFYAEQIKKRDASKELTEMLDLLVEQADIISGITEAARDFAQDNKNLDLKTVRVNEALDEILGLVADYVESQNCRLFKKYEGEAKARIDSGKLYQVFFQVAKNACQVMEGGGNIYVISSADENNIKIQVKNTGLFIPGNIREKIFEPFFSYNKEKTAGIGLAIAKKIISDHGGSITVEGEDEDTRFVITLPVYNEDSNV